MELASDFSEFCASLNANHVEYLVVGAYAMALHGVPRYTGDLEISFLGLDGLLINKRASGRTKDLADVEALTRRGRLNE